MAGKSKFPEKQCGEEIREQDFIDVIEGTREYGRLSVEGEFLLRTASSYIGKEAAYLWKNAKVAVLGTDLQLVFVSGYQSFQTVVTLDDNQSVTEFCEARNWKRVSVTSDGATSAIVWGDIKGTLTNRLVAILVGLIKGDALNESWFSPNHVKKGEVKTLRSRKQLTANGNSLRAVNKDCPANTSKPESWSERSEISRRSYKRYAVSFCVGLAVALTVILVYAV